MEDEYERVASFNFNLLLYLGAWKIRSDSILKKSLYGVYSFIVNAVMLFMVYLGALDLNASLHDINKVFFNICINLLIFGMWLKMQVTRRHIDTIDSLRMKLNRKMSTCKDEEELEIYKSAGKDNKLFSGFFYFLLAWLVPSWFVASVATGYLGEKDLPIPAKWPTEVDLNDDKIFFLICIFHGIFALFYLLIALPLDLCMYGLLIALRREYSFLHKDIREFGEVCDAFYDEHEMDVKKLKWREINSLLKRAKIRKMLADIIVRQKELLECTEDFEESYHGPMFLQIFMGAALLVVNAVQSIIVSTAYNVKMAYQIGYVFAIIYDMLILCFLADSVSTKVFLNVAFCLDVANVLYSTSWYKMDVETQRDILLVILRAQKPPRTTSGKFVVLNLHTFMEMMRNMFSWLALLRQLLIK